MTDSQRAEETSLVALRCCLLEGSKQRFQRLLFIQVQVAQDGLATVQLHQQ